MKALRLVFLVLCGLFLLIDSASALTIDNSAIDVGSIDSIVDNTTISSDYQSELSWIQSVLGSSYIFDESDKYDVFASDFTVTDTDPKVWGLNLYGTPDYYFIKLGTGGSDISSSHWLYQNIAELAWAVVDIGEWGTTNNIDIGRISHVGEVGESSTAIPEPATMILLGSGLVGLAGFRRKLKRRM